MSADRRSQTPPPILSLEGLAFRVEHQQRQLDELEGDAVTLKNIELMLVEAVGRSGKDGRVGAIADRLDASATSQGKRLGELEVDVGKLKQTRAQLYVLAAIGLALLGALIKVALSQ